MGVTYTVWADVLWLVNFMADAVLLWSAGRFGGYVVRLPRILLAAALGAFYGVGVLHPLLAPLYLLPLPLLCSLLMLWLAFGRMRLRRFGRLVACFYLLAVILGGTTLAVRYLLGGWLMQALQTVRLVWLLPGLLAVISLALLGVKFWRRSLRQNGRLVQAEISFDGRRVRLPCFLDSGNSLIEPVSGRPVLPVELAAVEKLLPQVLCDELWQAYQQEGMEFRAYQLLLKMRGLPWGGRLALVPYAAVGSHGGLLLGFVPDEIKLILADGQVVQPTTVPMLTPLFAALNGVCGAKALLNPDVLWESLDGIEDCGEYRAEEGRLMA